METREAEEGRSRSLVTGATGLLGRHLVERLLARGSKVRALVRPGSPADWLDQRGVEIVRGTLMDPDACEEAVQGVDIVYHAAAKVGDWGPWEEFRRGVVEATGQIAAQAADMGVERFVHISSTSAYGHPRVADRPVDESHPLGENLWLLWDHYTRSKVEAERLLWKLAAEQGLRLTVIRPSLMYGEGDRRITPRMVNRLRGPYRRIIGAGDNPISAVYAGAVADGAILAAHDPASVGEAYNLTDQGPITQQEFLDLFAQACGAARVSHRRPYWMAWAAATALEGFWRLTGKKHSPPISRYMIWVLGRRLTYSTQKARTRLGWVPEPDYREGIERSVQWYLRPEVDEPVHAGG